ncbi:putative structural protein [Oryza sativa Japonica Group]|jgi:hypothetical protein|uniref:Structural protein n=3 Tax=Oryza TaxID=4527 RepID=Q9LIT1_ORYSJ|nr:MFS18 protein [Oryza sativa Japonica Group]EAZ11266.1 hypothetical protein OsJ_01118 [Oryza sativa Japonica Group]KAF2949420.1 hypothetical protein DAI22_01g105200 [Oryza sativa Japonica Group]BAA92209.1 putative structural protein [Oryza sativa Japonica Group]
MEKSSKMMAVAAVLVLAVVGAAEARNIKAAAAAAAESKDTVVQPTTFPPFDRFGSAVPAFGGMPGSSIPGFSLPGSSGSTPGGLGGFGSMPMFGGLGGGSPGLGGGMPGSPAAADKQAKKP